MLKPRFFAIVLGCALLGAAGVASAQTTGPASVGLGIESPLTTGQTTGQFVYDAGAFHLDALLGYSGVENAADQLVVGGRGWFALHRGASSDFSLGGGLELLYTDVEVGDDDLSIGVELGGKIRAFVVDNVALHGVVGIAIVVGDESPDRIALTGQLTGGLGLTYFFR